MLVVYFFIEKTKALLTIEGDKENRIITCYKLQPLVDNIHSESFQ